MRVIVCGSRTWTDRGAIFDRLNELRPPLRIVHGSCSSGADKIADDWCLRAHVLGEDVAAERYPAEWGEYGKAAGMIRNTRMASAGAELCLAFRMPGKSNGTDDMVKKARAAGIPVEVITP
jgi:hypothetical protein